MVNFLLGILVGFVGLFLVSFILAVVDERLQRKDKQKVQSKTNSMAQLLHECAWMCGYHQGTLDNATGLSISAKEAYDRNNKRDEA